MTQYYKNTIEIAIAKYQAGAMNAIGLLFDYVKVKFRPDWKVTLNPKQVCNELGISSSTFYRTLKRVQQLLGKTIYLRQERVIPTYENQIPNPGTQIPTHENTIPTSGKIDCQTASKTNNFSDTPDLNTDLKQISLSKSQENPKQEEPVPVEEREEFLAFAMSKVDELPKRPTLPKKWIAANLYDLYSEFKKQSAPATQKNTADKQFTQWYDLMRSLGHATAQRIENGVVMIEDNSGYWSSYEEKSKFWSLDYLKKCAGGR